VGDTASVEAALTVTTSASVKSHQREQQLVSENGRGGGDEGRW